MAGINVPQYDILKISTSKLKYNKWDLHISKEEAIGFGEIVSLFESQEFRLIAKILHQPIKTVKFFDYIVIIEIDSIEHFNRIVKDKGILINGNQFNRFVGTTSGLKNNTIIFVRRDILDELNTLCRCGRKDIPIIPAKLEAYKALTCSASQPICEPRGILVVPDCITHIKENVLLLDDGKDVQKPDWQDGPALMSMQDYPLENTVSDGFNLCTIDYMSRVSESLGLDYITSGVCLRNAWLKGMLFPFPIIEFAEKYNGGNFIIKDIWGNNQDLRDIDMIITESSLKLWSAYDSIEDYMTKCRENGYGFAVTKIAPHVLEDKRELNYQYLQSYHFSQEDIEELCSESVSYLKDSCCIEYEQTKSFLGLHKAVDNNNWQQALAIDERFMGDPNVIDSVHRMLRNKIDQAKIGKLLVHGNYQICSGDPFALMQSVCGLEITGLLKAHEIYSKYWIDQGVNDVVVFRSPMTSHNNIRKCDINASEDCQYWYQYMKTILIYNGFDTICQALNGMDADGDIVFSTDNHILIKNYRSLPAIICVQRKAEKIIPTEADIITSDMNALGNKVGVITNRITTMMEVQSHFQPGSKEYETLDYRIICGQLFQQNEIDKLKGIIADPMPTSWYSYPACEKDAFKQSICANKKPYFMTYVYSDYRKKYTDYIKNCDRSAQESLGISLEIIQNKPRRTKEEEKFLTYFNKKNPFGRGLCSINQICYYIEREFYGIIPKIKNMHEFNYKFLLADTDDVADNVLEDVKTLINRYSKSMKSCMSKEDMNKSGINSESTLQSSKTSIRKFYKNTLANLIPDEKQRLNVVLYLCYGKHYSNTFMWDCVGDLIISRLKELHSDNYQ